MNRLKEDLDKVKASDELKQKTFLAIITKQNKKKYSSSLKLAFSILLVILAYNVYSYSDKENVTNTTPDIYSYVSIDINPSMKMQLDENNKVIDIIYYNEEASTLWNNKHLEGLTIQESLLRLLEDEEINTYIKNSFMQVSVYSKNQEYSMKLEKQIDDTLAKHLTANQYDCSNSSEKNYEEAQSHHISFGKYEIINWIIALDETYTIEDLQYYSMIEIKTLYENLSGESLSKGHESKGSKHGSGHHRN